MASDTKKRRAYHAELLKSASSELTKLPAKAFRDISNAIDSLERDPRPPGYIVLKGYNQPEDQPPICRIKVGDYRVIYRIKDNFLLVLVLKIGVREKDKVYAELARQMGRGKSLRRRRR